MSHTPADDASQRLHNLVQTLGGLAITCNDKTSLLKLVSYARRINQMKALEPEEIDIDELGELEATIPNLNPTDKTVGSEISSLNYDAIYFLNSFRRFGAIEDLERAVEKWQILVTLTPDSDPSKPGSLSNLGVALEIRFNRLGELVDLENAISNQRLAISLTTDGRPDKPSFFSNLGNALQTRFNRLGEMTDLEDAISSKRLAVSLTPDGHIEKPGFLNNLGTALNIRYSRLGELADLENAISSKRLAISLTPDGHPDKPSFLDNLGIALEVRFNRLGELVNLEDAITYKHLAVSLTPDGHPNKPGFLNNLGCALQTRFDRLSELADLENAISSKRLAVSLTPDKHQDKPNYLRNLGNALERRFKRLGELDDLENAISSNRLAVSLAPDGHPEKPGFLQSLGSSLETRFNRLGKLTDLEEAISSSRLAVSLTPEGHPKTPGRLANLANVLLIRFDQLGELADIRDAVSSNRLAVSLTPEGHQEKPRFLNNLGNALQTRFDRFSNLADLEDAISSNRLAVSLTPDEHPDKPTCLKTLGSALQIRFDRVGELADLKEAISSHRLAVSLTPDGHPDKVTRLSSLAIALEIRFNRAEELSDLEDAISNSRLAVSLIPNDHPDRPGHLTNLGNVLQSRFIRLGELADLEEAISCKRLAVSLTLKGHLDKPRLLNNLGSALQKRFDRLGELADLEESISSHRLAVSLTPDEHSDKPILLNNLARALKSQFSLNGDHADIQNAISYAQEAAHSVSAPSWIRLQGAALWAEYCLLASLSTLSAFDYAINLLPRVAWFGISVDDQYAFLAEICQVTRDAVSAAIFEGDVMRAIEWAEQGRSIVWQNLVSLRSMPDELLNQHPQLSDIFTRLQTISRQLEKSADVQTLSDGLQVTNAIDHRMKLAGERDELINMIRSTPGQENFMRPNSLQHLATAARNGPIVFLNLAPTRCDALVLTNDKGTGRVVNIPLERVTFQKAEDLSGKFVQLLCSVGIGTRDFRQPRFKGKGKNAEAGFKDILHILWTDYVQPIIHGLGYTVTEKRPPRLWWCTTGSLAFLPLHAAGWYDTAAEIGDRLSDYVVSSYTPSIAALFDQSRPTLSKSPRILTVAVSNTPGKPLPSTEREVESLRRLATNMQTVSLKNEEATKSRVLDELVRCNWAHLACHGVQVGGKPMSSGLILDNEEKLELSEIVKMRLLNADFVYLSACETAVGDQGIPEESAHLAAGMLFAGFRGAVATMWAIKDSVAPRVAEDVYRHMLNDGKADREEAVYGLHEAVRKLRESGEAFESWVPFIHIGC